MICKGSPWWSGNLGLCKCQFSHFPIFTLFFHFLHLSKLLLFRPKLTYPLFWHATADGSLFIIPNPGCRSFVALPRATKMSPLCGCICVDSSWWSGNLELCKCQFSHFHISQFSNYFHASACLSIVSVVLVFPVFPVVPPSLSHS